MQEVVKEERTEMENLNGNCDPSFRWFVQHNEKGWGIRILQCLYHKLAVIQLVESELNRVVVAKEPIIGSW